MIELKDLLEENETLVTFHLCNEYWSRNAITVKGNDDISGALEMTNEQDSKCYRIIK